MGGVCSRRGRDGNAYKIVVEQMMGRGHSEDPRLDEKVILKCIWDKYNMWVRIGFMWNTVMSLRGPTKSKEYPD
jgi:hypothetical protein